jgi:predicted small secreted protein
MPTKPSPDNRAGTFAGFEHLVVSFLGSLGDFAVKRILTVATCIVIMALFAGCNTVRGMGKDIEKAGDKIQDVAD